MASVPTGPHLRADNREMAFISLNRKETGSSRAVGAAMGLSSHCHCRAVEEPLMGLKQQHEWPCDPEGNQRGRGGGGAALYARGPLEQTELSLGMDNTWAGSWCERIKGQMKEGVFATGCLRRKLIRSFTDRGKQACGHRGTTTTLTSAGGTAQRGTKEPGSSWQALMETS